MQKIKATLREVFYGIMPMVVIITILQFTIASIPWGLYADFIIGTALLAIGLVLFLFGVEIGLIPIGESMGTSLVGSGKLRLILLFGFIIGFAVTVPEPDVQVLATQASRLSEGISRNALIVLIAIGVGLFVALALYRIFRGAPVIYILTAGYLFAFLLLLFCPPELAGIAFDSGGVTTGSLTVPFVMSLGVGVASITARRGSSSNTFGILALASLGPVITILLVGVLLG